MSNSSAKGDASYQQIKRLNQIGIALSSQRDKRQLLSLILTSARELTGAEAGTLYIRETGTLYIRETDVPSLRFDIVQNDRLNINLGGRDQSPVDNFPPIPLLTEDGKPNDKMVVAWSVNNNLTVNIPDAYSHKGFDFSGTRAFDQRTGYRSCSFLTVPLSDHDGHVIAALQLINKLNPKGEISPFTKKDQELAESLASQAAMAIINQRLINEMKTLFDSFTRVIATAIDSKSPHTGNHCRRVPDATLMLAEAACRSRHPAVKDFQMTEADFYELKTAAWLHDCGKVVTPHHVMEKSRKLETVIDRIGWVEDRLEILLRDLRINALELKMQALEQGTNVVADLESLKKREQTLLDDMEFLHHCNMGAEFVTDEDLQHLERIRNYVWADKKGSERTFLTEDEYRNLCIRRGTLNSDERKIMEGHMTATLSMLEQLPFPEHLKNVTEYAVCHHERMDGKGYPRGLSRDQMSIPARIMGIADVFEALTAPERPYKQPMKLSQALAIMGRMVEDNHLDPDLFQVFVEEKVYMTYGAKHMKPEQMDEVNLQELKGLNRSVV